MTAIAPERRAEGARTASPSSALPLPWGMAVAFLSGALTTLSFPPTRLPGAVLLGAAAGMWAMARMPSGRRGAACGLAWGLGFGSLMFRWALELDLVAYLGLVPLQAAFWALTGAAVARTARSGLDGRWVVTVAAVWTLVEAIRARWPLSGFEWGQLGLASADLPVREAAAVVGALGLTGLTVAVAASLVVLANRPARWRPLALSILAVGVLTGVGMLPWTSDDGELTVAVVQVDDPCPGEFAADCPNLRARLLEALVAGTAGLEDEPDLLLWGEGTLRADSPEEAGEVLHQDAGTLPAPLLAGITNPGEPGRYHNRNVLYDTDGEVLAHYSKRKPVPFGEYVPWRSTLGGIAEVGRLVPSDAIPGEDAVPMDVSGGRSATLGTVVSWEVTFSRLVRDAGRVGQGVAALTTQASYGPDQPVSDQLLGAAQLRAAELDQPVIVAATTGRSAVAMPGGELVGSTALYAGDTLEIDVPLRSGSTPYALWGEVPIIVVAAGVIGAMWWSRRDSNPRTVVPG